MNATPDAPASWAPTKKMRLVIAAILAADVAQLVAWINDSTTGKAALVTAILATAGAVGGYLATDD